jgi:hypothetical protein
VCQSGPRGQLYDVLGVRVQWSPNISANGHPAGRRQISARTRAPSYLRMLHHPGDHADPSSIVRACQRPVLETKFNQNKRGAYVAAGQPRRTAPIIPDRQIRIWLSEILRKYSSSRLTGLSSRTSPSHLRGADRESSRTRDGMRWTRQRCTQACSQGGFRASNARRRTALQRFAKASAGGHGRSKGWLRSLRTAAVWSWHPLWCNREARRPNRL